jgi:hypothetical protein
VKGNFDFIKMNGTTIKITFYLMGNSWTFFFARTTFEVHFYRIPRYKMAGAQRWLFIYLECQNQELLENIYPTNLIYNSEIAPCILVDISSNLS